MHDVAGGELRNKVLFVWANQEDDAVVSLGVHQCSWMKLG